MLIFFYLSILRNIKASDENRRENGPSTSTPPPEYEENESSINVGDVFLGSPPPYDLLFPSYTIETLDRPAYHVEPQNQIESEGGIFREIKRIYKENKSLVITITILAILVNIIAVIAYKINIEYVFLIPLLTLLVVFTYIFRYLYLN